mmetsp:Transcript_3707/g.6664  ORF Transcript_3707/g.6664 Transcript_3707/m.6664 type:complete len:89 (+) Transcript_3707:74-340(+)
MGAGASVQMLPTTHVEAATKDDVTSALSDLSAAERQKLQEALAILEGQSGPKAPITPPYPSLLGSTRLSDGEGKMGSGGYSGANIAMK